MAAEKILVGCKLPHGLYLDLRDEDRNVIARVKLKGNATYTLPNPARKFATPTLVHGDTFTEVEKSHWDEWLKRNPNHSALRSGAVYAAVKRDEAVGKARDHEEENVGFDKVTPDQHGVTKLDNKTKPD